ALRNALRVTGKQIEDIRVVISGAGAAGVACARILLAAGAGDLAVVDSKGVLSRDRADLNPVKLSLAEDTNTGGLSGRLTDALDGADLFLGVSGGTVPEDAVARNRTSERLYQGPRPVPGLKLQAMASSFQVASLWKFNTRLVCCSVADTWKSTRGLAEAVPENMTEGMAAPAAPASRVRRFIESLLWAEKLGGLEYDSACAHTRAICIVIRSSAYTFSTW
ncbi:MAG: hypothetical protein ACRD0P_27035, partial [Stackebrandtia sp.]